MCANRHRQPIAFPSRKSSATCCVLSTEFDTMNKVARSSLLPLLVAILALPTSLAFASPPDPTWIQGVYDEADFDNIVDLISSSAGVVDPLPVEDRGVTPLAIAVLPEMYERALSMEASALIRPRAPPQI